MMRKTAALFLTLIVVFTASCTAVFSGYAQNSKNKFEQHSAYDFSELQDGQQIVATTKNGQEISGVYIAARSDGSLLCLLEAKNGIASYHEIPEDQIAALAAQKEPLPLEPYLLMGLGLDSYLIGILLIGLNTAE